MKSHKNLSNAKSSFARRKNQAKPAKQERREWGTESSVEQRVEFRLNIPQPGTLYQINESASQSQRQVSGDGERMEYSPVTAKLSKRHRSSKHDSSVRRKQRSESPRTTLRRKSARTDDKSSHRRPDKRSAEPRRSTNPRSRLDVSDNSSRSKRKLRMSSASSESKRQASISSNSRSRAEHPQPYPKFMQRAKKGHRFQSFNHSHVASITQDLNKEDLVIYIILTQAARMIQKAFRAYVARRRHREAREAIRREILEDVDRLSQQRRRDRSLSDNKARSSGP